MITEKENKEIYSIIENFGGSNKIDLRKRLICLLENKEKTIKNSIINKIKNG